MDHVSPIEHKRNNKIITKMRYVEMIINSSMEIFPQQQPNKVNTIRLNFMLKSIKKRKERSLRFSKILQINPSYEKININNIPNKTTKNVSL